MCDPVPPKVELSESLEAYQLRDTRDLIASKVEHPQVGEMVQVLYLTDLRVTQH